MNHKKVFSLSKYESRNFWLYISPWIIGFLVFTAIPFFATIALSFMSWDILTSPRWIGIGNYERLLQDQLYFWPAFRNTMYYALVGVPLTIVTGLLVSILLFRQIKGINFYRVVFYLPAVFGGVAVLKLWSFLLAPGTGVGENPGLINALLSYVGIPGPGWSQSELWAKPAVILVGLWGVGGSMMIWLPALAGVPKEMLEAAEMDGAGRFKQFIRVSLPLMTPAVFFQVTMGIIAAFQIFMEPMVMPGLSKTWTDSMMILLFDNAFRFLKMGYASAIAWTLFIVIMFVTLIHMYLSRKWVYYEFK